MTFQNQFDPDTEKASTAVLYALAGIDDVNPIDINPPLAKNIDPDSLDIVVKQCDTDATQIVFTHAGYRVIVEAHGRVLIYDPNEDSSGPFSE